MPQGKDKVVLAWRSTGSLHDREFTSRDIVGGSNRPDSAGCFRINAIRSRAHEAITGRKHAHRGGEL
jgi:hypothetical protein